AVQERVKAEAARSVRTAAVVVVGAAALLAVGLALFVPLSAAGEVPRNRLLAVVFTSILLGQLAFAAATMKDLRSSYVALAEEKVRTVATRLHGDLQSLLNKGIAIDRLYRVETILRQLVDATPEVAGIQITDHAGTVLYEERRHALAPAGAPAADGGDFQVNLLLLRGRGQDAGPPGHLRIVLDAEQVQRKVRAFALDAVTVLLISLLFVTEVVLFLFLFLTRRAGRRRAPGSEGLPQAPTYGFVRTATAMFLFGVMQCASFVPLHMRQLAEASPLPGIAPNLLMGLPISVEMFCSLITVFLAGLWMDRRGWHEPFAVGIILASYAAFLCGTTTSPVAFLLYRGLAGLGYGLTWMSAQGFVVASTDPSSKARAISSLVAGIFVGHICGGAVGAMLADRIGFAAVFQVAAVLILLPLGFAAVFMRGLQTSPAGPSAAAGPAAAAEPNLLLRYVGSRNVLAVLLLSVVPFSLCQMGLLLFATPVYLSNLGVSQSSIGRSMMTYGFTVIYVAPYLSRFVDRSSRKGLFVAAGGVVGGLGLALVALVQGYYAILAAIFLMGVASSLAGPAQAVFALGHPMVQRLGTGKAVSVQRVADKLGQMLGPIVLGGLFAATTIETGLSLVGGLYIAASALFFLVTRRQPQPAC
ncbi:MAG: MFS transporter, partial [Deferrisomatales bacterium]